MALSAKRLAEWMTSDLSKLDLTSRRVPFEDAGGDARGLLVKATGATLDRRWHLRHAIVRREPTYRWSENPRTAPVLYGTKPTSERPCPVIAAYLIRKMENLRLCLLTSKSGV